MTEEFETVQEIVNFLEEEYNITVISIRDYGSRAWNLDSEKSDMDAGMVFRQKPMHYIQLGKHRENIDRTFKLEGEDFEVIGWNINRFAELLNKSNPSMIEWLNSDITYYEEYIAQTGGRIKKVEPAESFFEEIREHANKNFKPIALFYHYRSMAKSNYSKYIENENDLSIKRHLYILRGLTYARYVEKTHLMPPLDYVAFYEKQLPELVGENEFMPQRIYQRLGEFIAMKKQGEGNKEYRDEQLWDWMENELNHKLDKEEHDVRGIEKQKINELINKVIPR